MKRSIRVLLCALSGLGVSISSWVSVPFGVGVAPARAQAQAQDSPLNASDCMNFQNDVQEKAIVVHVSNRCERKFSCSIGYVVRCEARAGQPSTSRGTARFTLAANDSTEVPLSAEHCKQGWRIDDVSWACR